MPEIADRERRFDLQLPVEIRGRQPSGARFVESSRTLNVSGAGVSFECRRRLGVGDEVTLEIQLPPPLQKHFGGHPVYRARAVVSRVERHTGEDVDRVAARFLGEAPD